MKKLTFKTLKGPFFGRFMVPWRNPLNNDFLWNKHLLSSKSGGKIKVWSQGVNEAKATIVLAHPMGKPAKGEFLKTGYTNHLLKSGFNVVIFDFNGFGESTMGDFYYAHDLLAVRDFAHERFKLPLFLHGISFGANWGTVALSQEDNLFTAAILESGAPNLPEFWIHYPFAYKVLSLMYALLPSYKRYANFEKAISDTKNCDNVLFITADPDKYTPVSMAERMHAHCNVPSKILVFHDAEHAQSISSDQARYFAETVAFFNAQVRSSREKEIEFPVPDIKEKKELIA